MMKKYFYSMLAAGMLLATSCSEDELVDVTKGEGEKVTFKVELPGTQSRAIADGVEVGSGYYATKLIYAMYEEDKDDVLITDFVTDSNGDQTFEVTVPMAKDIKYDLLFMAYNPENCAFVINNTDARANDLKALKLKSGLTANTEQYDAFVGHRESHGINETNKTVDLKRPFAQVNVGTVCKDLDDIKTLKSEVVTSDFKIYGAPNTLNILTDEVTGSEELSYSVANILMKVDATEYPKYEVIKDVKTADGKDYYCLAMSYVLAGQTSSTHDADFRFYREDGKQVSSIDVVSMPIQANYRTNVVGTILTQVEQYEITISKMFADQYYEAEPARKVVVSTADDLESVIEAASEPTLVEVDGDITLGTESKAVSRTTSNGYITIPEGVSVTIDLKGHTITGYDNATASFGLINNSPGSVLSIINTSSTDGKITLKATNDRDWNAYSSVISNQRGTLTVGEGVVIEHQGGTDMAYGIDNLTNGKGTKAVTTINGATIKSSYRAIRQFLNGTQAFNELYVNSGTIEGANKSIWMQDANKSANPGKLVVKSDAVLNGDVYLYVTAGSTEWPVEVSVAESALQDKSTVISKNVPLSYDVTNEDGVWTVVGISGLSSNDDGSEYYVSSADALRWVANQSNAGTTFKGVTVKMTSDIDLKDVDWKPIGSENYFEGTFDGDNHVISNLNYRSTTSEWAIGLFGCTNNASFKNLTLKNVEINIALTDDEDWGHIGALVGFPVGKTAVENITLTGDVKILSTMERIGSGRIGAIMGGYNGNYTLKNVKVNANEGSYVKGSSSIGGIAGQLMGSATFESVESNIDVYGSVFGVGGIVGVAPEKATFESCSTSGNIYITAATTDNNLHRIGGIAGSWADNKTNELTLTNCSYSGNLSSKDANGNAIASFDLQGYVGRGYSTVVDAVVSINGYKYKYTENATWNAVEE